METISIYRVIRIDATFDPQRMTKESAEETAVSKMINDASAHNHTVENGLQINDIVDCGESL